MSQYLEKLKSLTEKENQLARDKEKLINQRKIEIAELAERCNLLTVSNDLLAGLFLRLHEWVTNNSPELKELTETGTPFLKKRSNLQATTENNRPAQSSKSTTKTSAHVKS